MSSVALGYNSPVTKYRTIRYLTYRQSCTRDSGGMTTSRSYLARATEATGKLSGSGSRQLCQWEGAHYGRGGGSTIKPTVWRQQKQKDEDSDEQ